MNRGEPEPMAAASAAGVKTEEDYVTNKRAKTTGDVDLTAAELVERLLKCDPKEIVALDADKIVSDAEAKEDTAELKHLVSNGYKLRGFFDTLCSRAGVAIYDQEERKRKAAKKEREEKNKRRADEKRRQREAKGCIACGGAVSEGQYKICAGKITFQGQRMRPCSGNAICSGCCEKMDAEGNPKKCSFCNNFLCDDCTFFEQCGVSVKDGDRTEYDGGCGKYVCHGCANGRALRKAVLCNCCDMFACHACAGELIPYVEKCGTCGKGGFWLCKNEECIEDSEEMELGCECDK